MPKISLPFIFALQTVMLVGAMVAIIVSFVLVTNKSIDDAVQNSVANNLETVAQNLNTLIREVEPVVWMGKQLISEEWGDDGYLFQTPARPTLESFNRSFSLEASMLQQNAKFAYAYQSFEYNATTWADLSCGNNTGIYSCTMADADAIEMYWEATTPGKALPLDYTPLDVYYRNPAEDDYILVIRGMTRDGGYNETGLWTPPSTFFEPVSGDTFALMTFTVPVTFDPTDGHCTMAFSVDLEISLIGQQLRRLTTVGNFLYVFHVESLMLVATSLKPSRLPVTYFVGNDSFWYALPNTPNEEVNGGARLILADAEKFGGIGVPQPGVRVLHYKDNVVSYRHIKHNTLHWVVVDHTPRDYYFGESRRVRTILIAVAACVVVACLAVSVLVYLAVVRPIVVMSEAMGRISRLEPGRRRRNTVAEAGGTYQAADGPMRIAAPGSGSSEDSGPALSELRPMHDAFVKLDLALQSFTRYVPRGVVKELMASGQLCRLEMLPRNCSVLFTDIAGFTNLSERVAASDLSRLIHIYFSRMSRVVMHHGGIIDKFIGDCIMAMWGAPLPQEHHELKATLCAMRMDREARSAPLSVEFENAGEELNIRTGVNSGDVLAGNMGSDERMNYTVIGDNVNLASRVEAFNKQMGTRVMITGSTASHLQGKVLLRLLCRVSVVGKEMPVEVYEPVGVMPGTNNFLSAAELTVADLNMDSSISLRELRERGESQLLGASGREGDGSGSYAPSEVNEDHVHGAVTLLKEAREHLLATWDEVDFASRCTACVKAYHAANFVDALDELDSLSSEHKDRATGKAIEWLREQCKAQLAAPTKDFSGVYRASEK